MSNILTINPPGVIPSIKAILEGQQIPPERVTDDRTRILAEKARDRFTSLSLPKAVTKEVSLAEFKAIYAGDGANAAESVLEEIIPHAVTLTLFAVTVGGALTKEIERLFAQNDFAAGAMLDAAASVGADLTAAAAEQHTEDALRHDSLIRADHGVMRFSPGYCGWHVSGQKKLFAALNPEQVGIELTPSCLMQPLKSVSGVIVAAPLKAFDFDDTYPYCADCATHSCRDRFGALLKKQTTHNTGN